MTYNYKSEKEINMKVLSISNIQQNSRLRRAALGCAAAIGLATLSLANSSCKKDVISQVDKPEVTSDLNKDHVDFAFRDFTNLFGLDTNGYTKVLKQAYVLNDGDYTIDTFQAPTNADTMYSRGVYYYNGSDQFIPHEQPYTSIWTRTTYDGQDAVKVDYKYSWENNAKTSEMPEPQEVYYIPGEAGDNSMKMYVHPGTGHFNAKVDVAGNTATYKVEDTTVSNPFWARIEQNYQ